MAASDDRKRSQRTPRVVVCDGKVAIDSYRQAVEILSRNRIKPRKGRSVYRCSHCGKYHLGSDGGRVERRKALEFAKEKARNE